MIPEDKLSLEGQECCQAKLLQEQNFVISWIYDKTLSSIETVPTCNFPVIVELFSSPQTYFSSYKTMPEMPLIDNA